MSEEVVDEDSIGKGHLNVGFVLEITSINADFDQSMGHDTLANFRAYALGESGYPEIWRSPESLKVLFEEWDFSGPLWMDPTSVFSYLSALTGVVSGDLLSLEFYSDPYPMDFNSASWEIIRHRLKTSLNHSFKLSPEHSHCDESPQSFYIEGASIDGSDRLSIERLESAISGLFATEKTSESALAFLDFFAPEVAAVKSLPPFVSGHIWAQLLSGCDWNLASQILQEDGVLDFDAGSFTWQVPGKDKNSGDYIGTWAVEWFRDVRRCLNFTPWPWRPDAKDQNYDPDTTGFLRAQVDRLLSGRQPAPQEKVAAFAMLYWLVDHDDNEDDDGPYTEDRVRRLIDHFLTDPLREFIAENLNLIRQCFTALNLTATKDGGDFYDEWLPEWAGSEGVLAGLPGSQGHLLEFEPSLFESVEKLWPEFIAIASQPLP
jgi:hypothetical protein